MSNSESCQPGDIPSNPSRLSPGSGPSPQTRHHPDLLSLPLLSLLRAQSSAKQTKLLVGNAYLKVQCFSIDQGLGSFRKATLTTALTYH